MASPASPYTECYVFLNDPDLWIADKTVTAKDANLDNRFRVDLGRFLQLIAKDRRIANAYLYGLVLPPNDSFWKAARDRNFKVKICNRSGRLSGQEKELDVAMACDIVEELYERESHNITFIIVTGDKVFMSPIRKCLKKQVHVELWSWEHSMAKDFKDLAKKDSLFTAEVLDKEKDHFSFTAHMTHHNKEIDPQQAIVYNNVPTDTDFLHELADHLARLLRVFYITRTGGDIIVEFQNSKPTDVLTKLDKLAFSHKPCSYETHTGRSQQRETYKFTAESDIDREFPFSLLANLGTDSSDDETESISSFLSSDASDHWFLEQRKHVRCKWGDHCAQASKCPFLHTEEEMELFEALPDIQFKKYKTKRCNKHHKTDEQKKFCIFAHSDQDSWCSKCKCYGHLLGNCDSCTAR